MQDWAVGGWIAAAVLAAAVGGWLMVLRRARRRQRARWAASLRVVRLARRQRRSVEDRRKEAAWIKAGLEAGLDIAFMARALRGSPGANGRRVRAVLVAMQTSRQPSAR